MNKKLTSIISILFLSSLLIISCNNKDKTSSTPNTDNNTKPTSKGLGHYAGNWEIKFDNPNLTSGAILNITPDGKASLVDEPNATVNKINDKGNEVYELLITTKEGESTLTLTFKNDNNGTFVYSVAGKSENGTITKTAVNP